MIKKVLWMRNPAILLLGLGFYSFSCHSVEQLDSEKSYVEIVENEIREPLIIITRREKKMIEAKSKKLYKNNKIRSRRKSQYLQKV